MQLPPSLLKILKKEIVRILPQTVALRRRIHAHPELSGDEYKTAALIFSTLKNEGIRSRFYLDKTAVTATIAGAKNSRTIVLRADLDALAQNEQNSVSFKSTIAGAMHACGHDMHAAMLVGAARVLVSLKKHLEGTVVCLFQPHEEKEPGGARRLIAAKAFPSETTAVFGLHVSSDLPSGTIGIKTGAECAAVFDFDIVIHGTGGHGAAPHSCIDPIVCSAALVTALQSLVSRESNPLQPVILSIGVLHSGSVRNSIPNRAILKGTVRTFSDDLLQKLKIRIRQMSSQIARSFGARAVITIIPSYPTGFNDIALANKSIAILQHSLGRKAVIQKTAPVMFAEDFAYYQKAAPGVLIHLGVRPRGKKQMPPLHAPNFLPDEGALTTGILAHCCLALGMVDQDE